MSVSVTSGSAPTLPTLQFGVSVPAMAQPSAGVQAAAQPLVYQPMVMQPIMLQPVVYQPVVFQPVVNQQVSTAMAAPAAVPVAAQPAVAAAAVTSPAPTTSFTGGGAGTGDLGPLVAQLGALVEQLTALVTQLTAYVTQQVSQQVGRAPASAGMRSSGGAAGAAPAARVTQTQVQQAAFAAPAADAIDTTSSSEDAVRQRILDLARAELALGVKEDRENNDSAGHIDRYRSAVKGKGNRLDEWCGDFASYITLHAGVPIGENGAGEINGNAMRRWAEKSGRWYSAKQAPKAGDLIMFEWKTGGHHVGVVERVENGRVYTIEGNSGHAVKARSYSLNASDIWGYIRTVG